MPSGKSINVIRELSIQGPPTIQTLNGKAKRHVGKTHQEHAINFHTVNCMYMRLKYATLLHSTTLPPAKRRILLVGISLGASVNWSTFYRETISPGLPIKKYFSNRHSIIFSRIFIAFKMTIIHIQNILYAYIVKLSIIVLWRSLSCKNIIQIWPNGTRDIAFWIS